MGKRSSLLILFVTDEEFDKINTRNQKKDCLSPNFPTEYNIIVQYYKKIYKSIFALTQKARVFDSGKHFHLSLPF